MGERNQYDSSQSGINQVESTSNPKWDAAAVSRYHAKKGGVIQRCASHPSLALRAALRGTLRAFYDEAS
jgi:hypothetical protein